MLEALAHLPLSDPPIDYIVIDTQPALSSLTKATIIASQHFLIPFRLDEPSVSGIDNFLGFVQSIETIHAIGPLRMLGGVAMAADSRTNLSERMRHAIPSRAANHALLVRQGLKEDRFWVGETRQRADFPRAESEFCSVAWLNPSSDATHDIERITREAMKRVDTSSHIPV